MGGQDWAHFSAGFAIGSVVEVAATVDTPKACLTQASSAGKSAFLAYYYYSEYLNPHNGGDSDKTNLVYSTFYLVEFVDALNKGGCYEFNLSVEDVQEYLGFNTAGQDAGDWAHWNGGDGTGEIITTNDDFMDTGPAIFNADPDSDVINFSNPFDDTSSHDKMAEIIGTFLNTVESVIDLASF